MAKKYVIVEEDEPTLAESFVSAGAGIGSILLGFLVAFVAVLMAVQFILTQLGIIKTGVRFDLKFSEENEYEMKDMSVVLLNVSDGKYTKTIKSFSKKGVAVADVEEADYEWFVSYDGGLMHLVKDHFGGDIRPQYDINLAPMMKRGVIVQFSDLDGNLLTPEQVTASDAAEQELSIDVIGDGKYLVILKDKDTGTGLTFSVPGYKTGTVPEDWTAQRLSQMEVRLAHE